ncbi:oligopeptide/dipeptide ABC transporter ATP-binding protein [Nocardioides halotolerans]|uniref:oligopeptide/dipeptide ABC transporter ATP-binding protein n=1 Tax=Nocardioides halotolerans TaxID=433660 RepID=UPI000418FD82|nr:ABC transporter ATP-binding protein [Nocardioides halotolerans]
MHAEPAPIAEVEKLAVTFQRRGETIHALREVDLTIRPGEVLGLVGESGSGKSVLGSAILGLLPAGASVTGRVLVDGVDMIHGGERARRTVRRLSLGAVFQDPMTSLNPTKRIGKQLHEVTGSDDEAVRLMESVGIPEARHRLRSFPHELSGGLRQRAMIAMSLAGGPKLLVADEPTTALDVSVQAQILDLLRDLCDDLGLAILFVTHDLGVASQVSDRIAVLYGGRQAELGPTADVLTRPRHPYSAALRSSRLTLTTPKQLQISSIEGETPDPSRPVEACPFGPRCAFHDTPCDNGLPALRAAAQGNTETACVREAELPADLTAVGTGAEWPATPITTPGPALTVRGARKSYRLGRGQRAVHIAALDGVDLTVARGEAVAVVGLSGCGKTTLLRSIAGLVELDEGELTLHDTGAPQVVFQDAGSSLTPWLSIGDLIEERLRGTGLAPDAQRARVEEAMRQVGLPAQLRTSRAAELSGGQRQRAAIARAIVVPPSLLLCDEPTSALDVSLAATILNLLGRLRRELDLALLFVTHDLAAARLVSERIVVMESGRIIEDGPADEVTQHPAHTLTRSLLAALPGPGRREQRQRYLTTSEDPNAALARTSGT